MPISVNPRSDNSNLKVNSCGGISCLVDKCLVEQVVLGPATVGGIQAGAFKIGDTAGTLDNIIHCKLYRPGSVGFVSKSVSFSLCRV
jgi:hypothetical protein